MAFSGQIQLRYFKFSLPIEIHALNCSQAASQQTQQKKDFLCCLLKPSLLGHCLNPGPIWDFCTNTALLTYSPALLNVNCNNADVSESPAEVRQGPSFIKRCCQGFSSF